MEQNLGSGTVYLQKGHSPVLWPSVNVFKCYYYLRKDPSDFCSHLFGTLLKTLKSAFVGCRKHAERSIRSAMLFEPAPTAPTA